MKERGNLFGVVLQGECDFIFFTDQRLNLLYRSKRNIKMWFKKNSTHSSNFSKYLIPYDGINNNLLIQKGEKVVLYKWQKSCKHFPERWQGTDDWTEYFQQKIK